MVYSSWLILIDIRWAFRKVKGTCGNKRAKRYVGYIHSGFRVLSPSQVLTDLPTITEESQTSDNDGGERPVRRKLKETSITSAPQNANTTGPDSRASSRGRKRSFDEEEPENEDESAHRRKRSRSSNIEENENGEKPTTPTDTERKDVDAAENASSKLMSPRRKRSRDQLDKTEANASKKGDKETTENEPSAEKATAEGEPEKKRHRDDPENKEKVSCIHWETNKKTIC